MCDACWSRLRGDPAAHIRNDPMAECCYCGTLTAAGIYVRQAAAEVHRTDDMRTAVKISGSDGPAASE